MSKINQISNNISDRLQEVFSDKFHDGDLSVIRGIINIELSKQEEFNLSPYKKHWVYTGTND